MLPIQYVTVKNTSARKPLRRFFEALDVKHNTAVCRLGAVKSKHKAIRAVNTLCSRVSKHCGHTKVNQQVKEALYNCILRHPQVVQIPIANEYFCVSIYANPK